MLRAVLIGTALVVLTPYGSALAFPDGAPWDMGMTDGCTLCHFEGEAITGSAALQISGLPEQITAGERYHLTVVFDEPQAATTGMMIAAWLTSPDGSDERPAGIMENMDATIEVRGNRARSTQAARQWDMIWQAPDQPKAESVSFILWGNAANGDESPFGDHIHAQQDKRPFKALPNKSTGIRP